MEKKRIPLVEHPLFLMGVTMLGGFMNTYTYVTRDGMLCTMHTGNMAKLGISLAEGNWAKAMSFLIPITACVCGSFFSELIKDLSSKKYDWRRNALLLEAIGLLLVAFIPSSAANIVVTSSLSFIAGFQLSLFRNCPWGGHSSTVCTGNLRSLGQYLYAAVKEHSPAALRRFFGYFCVVFSFVFGTAAGVPLCKSVGVMSSWAGAALAGILLLSMIIDGKINAN